MFNIGIYDLVKFHVRKPNQVWEELLNKNHWKQATSTCWIIHEYRLFTGVFSILTITSCLYTPWNTCGGDIFLVTNSLPVFYVLSFKTIRPFLIVRTLRHTTDDKRKRLDVQYLHRGCQLAMVGLFIGSLLMASIEVLPKWRQPTAGCTINIQMSGSKEVPRQF